MPPAEDRALHQYELLERVASGGMAEVFRARASGAHGFEKILAIKRILPDLARDPEFERRFIAEAKLTVALTHANIVQVHDFGRMGGTLYLAMEFVDGPDLAALLRALRDRDEPAPIGPALHIAIELAKGLDYAHRKGVVHHDVSPSNILVSREGEVKVADFGIALAAEGAVATRSARRVMGKWRYMSPEQTRGEKLDARGDLFSAGVVIYELLTGARPFVGDDAEAIVKAIREESVVPPTQLRPELPAALDAVLLRALERDPAKRWTSAAELSRALVEVSYARTLVATGLDVASLVAHACPKATPKGQTIDEAIARELLGTGGAIDARATPEPSRVTATMRRTATGQGGPTLIRTVGPDGLTRLELEGATTAPAAATKESTTAPAPASASGRGPGRLIVAAGVVLALGGGAYVATRDRGTPTPVAAAIDAAAGRATLVLETTPAGATIELDGARLPEVTPARVVVAPSSAASPHRVILALPGWRAHTDPGIVVAAGDEVRISAALARPTTVLDVTTTPAGASVELDDRELGTTPLHVEVPADAQGHLVRVRRRGFADLTTPVTLADGATIPIAGALAPATRFGTISLNVEPWADVYVDGRKVGQAPTPRLRLPVGHHTLRLVNPVAKKSGTLEVDVDGATTRLYQKKL